MQRSCDAGSIGVCMMGARARYTNLRKDKTIGEGERAAKEKATNTKIDDFHRYVVRQAEDKAVARRKKPE